MFFDLLFSVEQRTEIYEYAKVLGNPQSILISFQPYKLAYAEMLVECGKTAESLRCVSVSSVSHLVFVFYNERASYGK